MPILSGKIKVTNASADRQGKLFFKLTHSHHWNFFLQKSICGNALTVSEFQCRSLQNYWSYDMSCGFNIFLSDWLEVEVGNCTFVERSESGSVFSRADFCDYVSINKLSNMLTLLGKCGWFNARWTMKEQQASLCLRLFFAPHFNEGL